MSSHGTRNWNDIAAVARRILDRALDRFEWPEGHDPDDWEELRALLETVDASRAEPTEADPYPDGLPEDLYVDIESTIHQHCGHDGQSDEANDWVTDLMSALTPPAEVDGPWRASGSNTATIVAGGRHPITDEMYPFALFHEGKPADLYMATVIARLLNASVGGRSAAPTRDDLFVAVDIGLNAAGLGWSDKRQRWVIDSILNALAPVLALGWSAAPTREQVEHALKALAALRFVIAPAESAMKRDAYDEVKAVLDALLSRSAADPPSEAAGFIYDPESDRWCCIACEQWSDEGADVGTIAHADHSGVAAEPNEEAGDGR